MGDVMKAIIVVLVLALFLVACGDNATGDVVLGEEQTRISQLQQEINSLMGEISATKDTVDAKVADIKDLELANDALDAALAKKEELVNFQKQILREMEDEKNTAVADQEGCDERISELENKNDVLQKWVNICQDELDVQLE